jgi:hypothetical protein
VVRCFPTGGSFNHSLIRHPPSSSVIRAAYGRYSGLITTPTGLPLPTMPGGSAGPGAGGCLAAGTAGRGSASRRLPGSAVRSVPLERYGWTPGQATRTISHQVVPWEPTVWIAGGARHRRRRPAALLSLAGAINGRHGPSGVGGGGQSHPHSVRQPLHWLNPAAPSPGSPPGTTRTNCIGHGIASQWHSTPTVNA